ncbi:hypothetical protein SAMN05421578_12911 [Paenibacillus macquariensis]|uniref:YHYH domain-containing protein n=1 Tax=Paenibacillus macquariensis TaxID=948756 RepID=A0ABY1KDJ9_9BACL|nr:hypothetical protein SAMN05421578_12911 [Paenibacillus macquariensis]
MKKNVIFSIFMVILLVTLPAETTAHPGRTDANGGHYCRTNCAKWGLEDGEYHYPNGGGSSSSSAKVVEKEKEETKSEPKSNTTPAAASLLLPKKQSLGTLQVNKEIQR